MEPMHAVRAHTRGGPEQLVYETAPIPRLRPEDALVKAHAAAITPSELGWDLSWTDPEGNPRTPVIPSHEIAGEVVEVAAEAPRSLVGKQVFALTAFDRDGGAAEYVAVHAADLAAKPTKLSHVEAATLPLSALTAWQALFDHATLQFGQHVLVHGAAGGVGGFAVQVALHAGARVSATCRSGDVVYVRDLGADQVLAADREPFEDAIRDVDVVLDTIGGETQARTWPLVRRGGMLITLAAPPDQTLADRHGVRGVFFVVRPNRDELTEIARLTDSGKLRPLVGATYRLDQGPAAYRHRLLPGARGKIVLEVIAD